MKKSKILTSVSAILIMMCSLVAVSCGNSNGRSNGNSNDGSKTVTCEVCGKTIPKSEAMEATVATGQTVVCCHDCYVVGYQMRRVF